MLTNWMYPYAKLNNYDPHQIKLISQACERLYRKLTCLDLSSLSISDYNKKYFGNYLQTIEATLARYSYLLLLSIDRSNIALNDFVFIDYGAGSGILALLAKELNIGTVIYNDIYDVSCQDARLIAQAIGNEADYYIQGDIDEVKIVFENNALACDAISSYDVIEHIYDVDLFMKKIPCLLKSCGKIVMETTANPSNPLIKWQRMKIHKQCEYQDKIAKYGHKEIDTLKSYLSVRKEIISQYSQKLKVSEVDLLAQKTRGLIDRDIINCVDRYINKGELPQDPTHPTNTCDPYTGNWAEHLIEPTYWQRSLNKLNFETTILGGYYSYHNFSVVALIKNVLNYLISIFKQKHIALSSSYIVYATKK
jgi:2-polyprenyl-3-methyl-5-hydroxy-6-metoxy-1,4-benzoquinol methylase